MGPAIIRHNGCEIKEFPVSTKEILGKQIIFSGGGYFRLAPYYLLHKWSREAAEKLRQYLKDFRFTDVRSAAEMIEWSKVPVVEL